MVDTIFIVLTLLTLKHFFCDFVIQFHYMVLEKGTYGAMGGIHHSAFHGLFTLFILMFFAPQYAIWLAFVDFVVHYHVDWAKMNINRIKGYTPKDDGFWLWLGIDQLAHSLTYLGIVYFIFC